jgi:hypothetical protein
VSKLLLNSRSRYAVSSAWSIRPVAPFEVTRQYHWLTERNLLRDDPFALLQCWYADDQIIKMGGCLAGERG